MIYVYDALKICLLESIFRDVPAPNKSGGIDLFFDWQNNEFLDEVVYTSLEASEGEEIILNGESKSPLFLFAEKTSPSFSEVIWRWDDTFSTWLEEDVIQSNHQQVTFGGAPLIKANLLYLSFFFFEDMLFSQMDDSYVWSYSPADAYSRFLSIFSLDELPSSSLEATNFLTFEEVTENFAEGNDDLQISGLVLYCSPLQEKEVESVEGFVNLNSRGRLFFSIGAASQEDTSLFPVVGSEDVVYFNYFPDLAVEVGNRKFFKWNAISESYELIDESDIIYCFTIDESGIVLTYNTPPTFTRELPETGVAGKLYIVSSPTIPEGTNIPMYSRIFNFFVWESQDNNLSVNCDDFYDIYNIEKGKTLKAALQLLDPQPKIRRSALVFDWKMVLE